MTADDLRAMLGLVVQVHGLTHVSQESGVSKGTIVNVLKGRRHPVGKLARFLGYSVKVVRSTRWEYAPLTEETPKT